MSPRTDWRMPAADRAALDRANGAPVRLALDRREAADALGISLDSFERHVQGHVPCTYIGAKRIYSIAALEHWLETSAVTTTNGGTIR